MPCGRSCVSAITCRCCLISTSRRAAILHATVSLLDRMARFVVADIAEARSIPQELMVIAPDLSSVPIQPLLQEGAGEYGMFEHFRRYPWVLKEHVYASPQHLIADLGERVIGPAEAKVRELRGLTSGSAAPAPFA